MFLGTGRDPRKDLPQVSCIFLLKILSIFLQTTETSFVTSKMMVFTLTRTMAAKASSIVTTIMLTTSLVQEVFCLMLKQGCVIGQGMSRVLSVRGLYSWSKECSFNQSVQHSLYCSFAFLHSKLKTFFICDVFYQATLLCIITQLATNFLCR